MTKYKESHLLRLNKFIENRLRGISELSGTSDSTMQVIPLATAYVTDVDTNNAFQDSVTSIAIPFMSPAQQTPEAMTPYTAGNRTTEIFKRLPICTYSFMNKGVYDESWNKCGQVVYTFYHGDIDLLIEISNFVIDLCNRNDWTAADINYFYRNDATNPFDFKSIGVTSAIGPGPADDEGGLYSYLIVIYCEATYEGLNRVNNYSLGVHRDLGMI
jgi:hypothetical protein